MIMENMTFSCPSCSIEYEVFLKEIPFLMLIQCPSCHSALSCFEGEITVASDNLLEDIRGAESYDEIKKAIKKHTTVKKSLVNLSNRRAITDDDILNLKIDLGLSKTFKDVFKVINGNSKK